MPNRDGVEGRTPAPRSGMQSAARRFAIDKRSSTMR
jgi:hypothetical protein